MDLKTAQLRHFVNVATAGSFKEGARRSFRSQPAVSLSIRSLEQQIGAALFESGKRDTLTGLGATVLPLIREFLAYQDRFQDALMKAARGEAGEISIAVNSSVATRWLPRIVREYAKNHPAVVVFVADDNSESIRDLVASGRIDIGVASMGQARADVDFTPILSDSFGLVCHKDHPLASRGGKLEWTMLGMEPMIGNMTNRLLEGSPAYGYVSKPRIFMSTLTSLLANVEGKLGVTVLPRMALPESNRNLAFIELRAPRLKRTLGICLRRGRTLPPHAAAMCDLILRLFATETRKPGFERSEARPARRRGS